MFLKAKLHFVKKAISYLRKTDAANESNALIQLMKMVDELENLVELRTMSEEELTERRDNKAKICELEKLAKMNIQQKANICWLSDGDENTHFFHNTIKCKSRKIRLHGLLIYGVWNTRPTDIKREVHLFFGNKFHERWLIILRLINNEFKVLSMDQKTV